MENSIGSEARPFIVRTGFFYAVIVAFLLKLAHAQPPGWEVNSFRSMSNSRPALLDVKVGTNDYSVLPIAVATLVVFGGLSLAKKDSCAFDAGVMVGMSQASAYTVCYLFKNVVKPDRAYVTLYDVYTKHLGVQLTAPPVPALVTLKISF